MNATEKSTSWTREHLFRAAAKWIRIGMEGQHKNARTQRWDFGSHPIDRMAEWIVDPRWGNEDAVVACTFNYAKAVLLDGYQSLQTRMHCGLQFALERDPIRLASHYGVLADLEYAKRNSLEDEGPAVCPNCKRPMDTSDSSPTSQSGGFRKWVETTWSRLLPKFLQREAKQKS